MCSDAPDLAGVESKGGKMRKIVLGIVMALAVAAFAVPAFATNGDDVMGVGAISRSMGGTGIAAPQDAITAVFGNPAAMCYIPCETSEVDFAATIFDPSVRTTVTSFFGGTKKATSQGAPYAFPAIGIYTPITPDLRFGLAAYGVSGMGVDYKDSDLTSVMGPGADLKTDFQVMKFAPNLAYRILPNLSVGAALQVNWAQLDLGDGSGHAFGVGTQLGIIYKPVDALSLGLTYQTPQKHSFKRIYDFDGNGQRDRLALEQPQQIGIGIAYDIIPNKLLVEVDGKWKNWGNAAGYEDFGWIDQYIVAVGVQAKPVDWLALRVGYNYGNNPVKESNGWGFANVDVQGTNVSRPFLEYFKVVGFPAIVEQHITAGLGVNLTKKVSINAGYTHAFEKSISETSFGGAFKFESSLSEDSYEFGLNIMF